MKLSRKIAICVLSAVVILSSMVLPSFAWEITTDQEGYPTVNTTTFTYRGEIYDGYYRFYRTYETHFRPFENPNSTNTASNSAYQIQLADNNGMLLNVFVKIPNNQDYEIQAFRSPYGTLEIDLELDATYKGISEMRFIPTSTYVNPGNLRILIKTVPTYETVLNEYVDFVESGDASPIVSELRQEIASLEAQVREKNNIIDAKDNTIAGLQNNNVLDGVFSGIGDGFSSMMTPLLSLSVGGVSLGNVIGVLLIIGAILLFVLLINKLRGA